LIANNAAAGEFLLRVSANCDVGFYAQPDLCTRDADGVECADESLETCASAVAMTIVTIDRAVHVKHNFDIPLPPGGLRRLRNLQSQGPASQGEVVHLDRLQLAATLFQVNQPPAMAFATNIVPLDCNSAEMLDRPLCVEHRRRQGAGANGGGGHRRTQDGELGCPHSTFVRREEAMRAACGLPRDRDFGGTEPFPSKVRTLGVCRRESIFARCYCVGAEARAFPRPSLPLAPVCC